ncbi:MAG TPA: twin-arginine translocase TatA/TatE family subunit [Thermoanaerobaculia bacterium]|nr:twin-arginine translocase TatA/TatE family subunit [Thermoanaerobaculia bacterium]
MLYPEMVLLLMPSLGIPELLIIFLIIMVLFGASRLPQIGKGLGEGIKNFKRGLKAGEEEAEQIPEKSESRRA